jgi:hypothetical protein
MTKDIIVQRGPIANKKLFLSKTLVHATCLALEDREGREETRMFV